MEEAKTEKPHFWTTKVRHNNDTWGWNDRPTKVGFISERPIAEIFSLTASNGVETVLFRVLQDGRFYGPLIGERFYEDDGIMQRNEEDRDITPVGAASIDHVIEQRNALADALRSIVKEVNETGFLNRGEQSITDAETILGYYDEATLPPLPPKAEVPA